MKNYLILSLSLASLVACSTKETKTSIPTINPKTLSLDTLYTDLFQEGKFNGNVLVAEKGEICFNKSFGIANKATNKELNTHSVFELASVSKQFTAMGIVLLKKQGQLNYNDPIVKYIPELEHYPDITIKHLLTHTGGLPDYMALADSHWDKTKIANNLDIINLFKTHTPEVRFKPNEEWRYSNTGYLILGSIIERVSGQTFEDYLTQHIFAPLKMDRTSIYRRRYKPEHIPNYASGYIYSDSLKTTILPDDLGRDFYMIFLDGIVGDGMVNSNVADLLKWDRALYDNTLINEEDKKLIFSSYKTNTKEETEYGFGWMIDSTETYGKVVSHSGGWAGYTTYIERHLDNDKTIIILQNQSTPKTEIPVKNTRRIAYNMPIEKPIDLDVSLIKPYVGTYLNDKQKERKIILENDKIYIQMAPDYKMELVPVSQTKFIVDGFTPEVSFTFIKDQEGKVIKYHVVQEANGVNKEAIKIE